MKLVLQTALLELALILAAAIAAQTNHVPYGNPIRDVIAGLAAAAMGFQNATARKLAVPDLTT